MNEQERFWKGEFGDKYIERNTLDGLPQCINRWSRILSALPEPPSSILELGCNIGINLHALHTILPQASLDAVEINARAIDYVRKWGHARVHEGSLLDFLAPQQYELSFTSGVLIHIAPELLPKAYETLYNSSSKYICIQEYYNLTPVEIEYHGHMGKLFKRDFCGEMLDSFADLRLIDYGFFYHRDALQSLEDCSFFLMEKSG